MDTKFLEASNGFNWGKFSLGRFTSEDWYEPSLFPGCEEPSLLAGRGWTQRHIQVFDLQTGEGAMFMLGGFATADLFKHRIWVCPLFEPVLSWLYSHAHARPLTWWDELPRTVELPAAPAEMFGFRRPGPDADDLPATAPRLAAAARRRRVRRANQRNVASA